MDLKIGVFEGEDYLNPDILQAVPIPGHTFGNTSYFHVPSGTLFCGDGFMKIPPPKLFGNKIGKLQGPLSLSISHKLSAIQSIVNMSKMEFIKVHPAHGT